MQRASSAKDRSSSALLSSARSFSLSAHNHMVMAEMLIYIQHFCELIAQLLLLLFRQETFAGASQVAQYPT